jgi:hypothetical protein
MHMLLRFGVENHRSIRSYLEISLIASKLKDSERGLLPLQSSNPSNSTKAAASRLLRVVPVVALYGANASGKSTVLNALDFFVNAVIHSHASGGPGDKTPHTPFLLDDESKTRPSRYDVDIALDDVRYHFGFTLDGKRILSEWLYSYPIAGVRQTRTVLYHRDVDQKGDFYFGKQLRGENKQIAKLVRTNSLFLSAAAQNAHPQIVPLFEFFSTKITRRLDSSESSSNMVEELVAYFGADERRREAALRFLKAADIGISGIDFSSVPIKEEAKAFMEDIEQVIGRHLKQSITLPKKEMPKVELLHAGAIDKNYPIRIGHESAGTISLLRLLGPVFQRLGEGGVLLVDELNSTLHPLVARELILLFSSPETNPGKAQLLFSTHDTNILAGQLLRRDQIWFTEKDRDGATHAYSMSDFKVRGTENLEVGYLSGRFGSAPRFNAIEKRFEK